jgi:hypothetical protein
MSTSLNRRALVAGAAVLPAIAVPAAAQCVLGGDAELRRLWSEYSSQRALYLSAYETYRPRRVAFDAAMPPCPDDVLLGHHWRAHEWLFQKYGVQKPLEAMNEASAAMRDTVDAIRRIDAVGLFGVGVKLAALETGPFHGTIGGEAEDYEEAARSTLAGIDRILGTSFSPPTDDKNAKGCES